METKTRTPVQTHHVKVQFRFGGDYTAECSCNKWYRLGFRHQERAARAAASHAVEFDGTVELVTR